MQCVRCLINNKKRYHSIFKQIASCEDAIVKVIKDNKVKSIELVLTQEEELLSETARHIRFSIFIMNKNEKIIEFIIRDMKIYFPLNEESKF